MSDLSELTPKQLEEMRAHLEKARAVLEGVKEPEPADPSDASDAVTSDQIHEWAVAAKRSAREADSTRRALDSQAADLRADLHKAATKRI